MEPGAEEFEIEVRKATTEKKRIGGSLMIRIPADVAREEGIAAGDLVEIQVKKARKSWFGATPGIGPFTHEDELDMHD